MKTSFKLCQCRKVFRADAFKKHACTNKKQIGVARYYCGVHKVSRLSERLEDWHSQHSECQTGEVGEEERSSLFATELRSLELQSANEQERSSLFTTEATELQSAIEAIAAVSSLSSESSLTSSDSEEEEGELQSQLIKDVDLDRETPTAVTVSGIATQCRNFVKRPPVIAERDRLKKEAEKLKEEAFSYKAKYEDLKNVAGEMKKVKERLSERDGELEQERLKTLEGKAREEALLAERESREKEIRRLKEEVERLRVQMAKVVETNHELHRSAQLVDRDRRVRSSRLHIPIRKGRVAETPLLYERGRGEKCYSRVKKGVECLHFTFDHRDPISNFLYEEASEKICK